jgi:hypothetical protein
MRRMTVWLSIVVLALATSASPAFAIKPSAKPPKPTVAKTQAPKSTVKAPKPVNASAPKAAKAPKAANASAPKAAKASAPKSAKSSTTTTTLPPPNTPTTLNPIAQKLQGKPNQLAKLEAALGLGTLTPEQLNGATSGFKNFGQVNAATNTVLHNPTVKFADLKALMTGLDMKGQPVPGQTTTYSLGQAKQRLGIADGDDSPTAPTTTSSTTTKAKKRTTTSGGTH